MLCKVKCTFPILYDGAVLNCAMLLVEEKSSSRFLFHDIL